MSEEYTPVGCLPRLPPTLAEFLLARIDEAQAAAPQDHLPAWCDMAIHPEWNVRCDCGLDERRRFALAECEAKREVIRLLALQTATTPGQSVEYRCLWWLARPYADHAQYRKEWNQ